MTVICYLCLLLFNKYDKFTRFLCQMSVTRHGKKSCANNTHKSKRMSNREIFL